MYGIYNNRRAVVPYVWYLLQQTCRRPLCMVCITTDVPSSLMYGIHSNRRAVVPYVWYL